MQTLSLRVVDLPIQIYAELLLIYIDTVRLGAERLTHLLARSHIWDRRSFLFQWHLGALPLK